MKLPSLFVPNLDADQKRSSPIEDERPKTDAGPFGPFNVIDRGVWVLYDWLVEPPGCETLGHYSLWTIPIGDAGHPEYARSSTGRRDISDTNLHIPGGMLPAPQSFVAQSIHTFFGTTKEEDREKFREAYLLEFIIGQKVYYQVPLVAIPAQGVLMRDLKPLRKPSWPDPPGDFGNYPRYIPPLVHTQINLMGKPFITDRNRRGIRFLVAVLGTLDRAVQ